MPTRTLQKIQLDLNADCVAWCPVLSDSDVVLCGQYQLVKGKGNERDERIGGISVFRLERSADGPRLKQNQFLKLPGVFDLKWRTEPINGIPTCAAALANGTVSIMQLKDGHLVEVSNVLVSKDQMVLSLDWLTWKGERTWYSIVASLDNGRASCIQYNPSASVTTSDKSENEKHAHVFELGDCNFHAAEVWTMAADPWYNGRFYTGADDSILKMWQLEEMFFDENPLRGLGELRGHTSGVCTIQSNPYVPGVVASGSYDEVVRVWDMRQPKQCLYRVPVAGGVWKLRWRPPGDSLVAAAMHAGCCVIQDITVHPGESAASIEPQTLPVIPYVDHGSLAYGIDFCPECPSLIASCSFYDNYLHLWEICSGD